jgi:hypothetical protein
MSLPEGIASASFPKHGAIPHSRAYFSITAVIGKDAAVIARARFPPSRPFNSNSLRRRRSAGGGP